MTKFKALLFDLDGTLLDTIEDLTDSMNAALARLGFPGHSVEACKQLVGEGIEHFAASALPSEQSRNEAMVARCVRLMREEYRKRWAAKTHPYDGIAELLDALAGRGLRLAVLSNKADDFTKMMVSHFLPGWRFATVVGAKPGVARKPDPAPALRVAEELRLGPGEILFLGDTKTDMETARAAGMYPVGALWGFRSAEELLASGARNLIRRPDELLGLIDAR
jgi:phosphoglycolate phosphatase